MQSWVLIPLLSAGPKTIKRIQAKAVSKSTFLYCKIWHLFFFFPSWKTQTRIVKKKKPHSAFASASASASAYGMVYLELKMRVIKTKSRYLGSSFLVNQTEKWQGPYLTTPTAKRKGASSIMIPFHLPNDKTKHIQNKTKHKIENINRY